MGYVTETMLRDALHTVTIKNGPEHVQKYIKGRYSFKLIVDRANKKVLAYFGGQEIIFDINFEDIVSAVCLDANEKQENRHRVQIVTKNGDIYDFYVSIPYHSDPLLFLRDLNYAMGYNLNPEKYEKDEFIGTLVAGVLFGAIVTFLIAMLD